MRVTLSVPPEMVKSLRAFVKRRRISIGIVGLTGGTAQVVRSGRPGECRGNRLVVGGWIRCVWAHRLSTKLGMTPRSMGKLLDHLDIQVRHCELGLFR